MSEYPVVATGDGVTRQVLANHPDLMVVAFRFARQGAEGTPHSHPHVQSTYVESGQFRFTLNEDSWEIPEGGCPLGTDPLESAKRELREETGYAAKKWKVVHKRYPGMSSVWHTTVYAARDLTYSPLKGDENFPIELAPTPFKKAVQMALDGTIRSEFIAYCILRFDYLLKTKKWKW